MNSVRKDVSEKEKLQYTMWKNTRNTLDRLNRYQLCDDDIISKPSDTQNNEDVVFVSSSSLPKRPPNHLIPAILRKPAKSAKVNIKPIIRPRQKKTACDSADEVDLGSRRFFVDAGIQQKQINPEMVAYGADLIQEESAGVNFASMRLPPRIEDSLQRRVFFPSPSTKNNNFQQCSDVSKHTVTSSTGTTKVLRTNLDVEVPVKKVKTKRVLKPRLSQARQSVSTVKSATEHINESSSDDMSLFVWDKVNIISSRVCSNSPRKILPKSGSSEILSLPTINKSDKALNKQNTQLRSNVNAVLLNSLEISSKSSVDVRTKALSSPSKSPHIPAVPLKSLTDSTIIAARNGVPSTLSMISKKSRTAAIKSLGMVKPGVSTKLASAKSAKIDRQQESTAKTILAKSSTTSLRENVPLKSNSPQVSTELPSIVTIDKFKEEETSKKSAEHPRTKAIVKKRLSKGVAHKLRNSKKELELTEALQSSSAQPAVLSEQLPASLVNVKNEMLTTPNSPRDATPTDAASVCELNNLLRSANSLTGNTSVKSDLMSAELPHVDESIAIVTRSTRDYVLQSQGMPSTSAFLRGVEDDEEWVFDETKASPENALHLEMSNAITNDSNNEQQQNVKEKIEAPKSFCNSTLTDDDKELIRRYEKRPAAGDDHNGLSTSLLPDDEQKPTRNELIINSHQLDTSTTRNAKKKRKRDSKLMSNKRIKAEPIVSLISDDEEQNRIDFVLPNVLPSAVNGEKYDLETEKRLKDIWIMGREELKLEVELEVVDSQIKAARDQLSTLNNQRSQILLRRDSIRKRIEEERLRIKKNQ